MGVLWLGGEDDSGAAWCAGWGSVTDAQVDAITEFVEALIGRADTVG